MNKKTKGNYRDIFGGIKQADNGNAKQKLPLPLKSTQGLLEYAPPRFSSLWLLLYADHFCWRPLLHFKESKVSSSSLLCSSLPPSFLVFSLLLHL